MQHQDVVYIKNLVFEAILGVLPHERTTPQEVCINLEVTLNTRAAAVAEDLSLTLDYAKLADAVQTLTQSAECLLVETLADKIATLTLEQPHVEAVTVDVGKPQALAQAQAVGVRIYRARI